jgi:hypothetical protein
MSLQRFLAQSILPIRFFQSSRTRRTSRTRKALRARLWQPSLLELESRFAPAVNISIQAGVLTAQCDNGFNQVTVFHSGSSAVINGQSFSDSSYSSIRVNAGTGGTQAFIEANVKPVTVNGGSSSDFDGLGNGGSLAGILAPVTLNNDLFFSHVDIQDGADNTHHGNVVLTASSLTGLAPAAINFQLDSLSGLTITVGNGHNTYTVVNTQASGAVGGNQTMLNIGSGATTFHDFDNVEIQGVAPSAPLTVNDLGDQPVQMNVDVGFGVGTVAGIQGTLTLHHHLGDMFVNILDGADNTDHLNVRETDLGLTGLSQGAINWTFDTPFDLPLTGLNIQVGNGNNTYTLNNIVPDRLVPAPNFTLDTGNGNDTVNVQGVGQFEQTTINAGSGTHAVNVSGAINGGLTINNFLTTSTMFVSIVDTSGTNHPNVMLTDGSVTGLFGGDITFHGSAFAALTITGGNGNNTYTVANSGSGNPTVLNTGNGDDTVNIQGTSVFAPFTVNAAGRGNDVINVGNAGSLAGINGTPTLNNGPNFSHVNINDGADSTDHPDVRLTSFSLTGLSPAAINFEGESLDGLTVTGGSGNNTYTVLNTQFSGPGNPTLLTTGNGNDTVNVQATNFNAPLTVSAGSGSDVVNVGNAGTLTEINSALTINTTSSASQVNINDGADNTDHSSVQLTANGLTGQASSAINFGANSQGALNIAVGNGNDNFLISGTPTTLRTTLSTGTGLNIVTVTGTGGPLTLTGNPATINKLIGPNATTTWNITGRNAGNFSSAGAAASFTDYKQVVGGGGSNTFVFSDGAIISGTVDGGSGGANTIDSSAYTTSELFAFFGANAGRGDPAGSFINIQNFIGGAGGNNDFAFVDGGSIDGSINGGSGTGNTLDYLIGGFSGNVLVDLQTGTATGVAGGVTNIQNVLGASGGGSGFFNLLIGNGGNVLQGGTGRRNILVAGGSPSTLVGGDGEDLLIAGSTAYDTEPDLASWQAIANLWTDADPFATRVANLLSGTGVPILDPLGATGHVFGNGGGNTLTGNGALTLLFSDGFDGISGFDPNSQQVTIGP